MGTEFIQATRRNKRGLRRPAVVADKIGFHSMCAGWGLAEIDALLESDNPSRAFAAIEDRLGGSPAADQPHIRGQIIEALDAAFKSGRLVARDWLPALCEASPDYLRASETTRRLPSARSNEERLHALLIGVFNQRTASERGELISFLLAGLGDISLPCGLFCGVDGDGTKERSAAESGDGYFGAFTDGLRNNLLGRVTHLAEAGALWMQASPSALLWFWFACGQEQQVYVFVKQSMRATGSLVRLLEMPIDRVQSSEGGHDVVLVRRWSKIIDFNGLEKRAVEFLLSGAAKADKTSARRFLDAYANGKSELFK